MTSDVFGLGHIPYYLHPQNETVELTVMLDIFYNCVDTTAPSANPSHGMGLPFLSHARLKLCLIAWRQQTLNSRKRELGWLLVVSFVAIAGCGAKSDLETNGSTLTGSTAPETSKAAGPKVNDPTVIFYTYIEAGCKNCTDVAALFVELALEYKDVASFQRRDSNDKTYDKEKKRLGLAGHLVVIIDGDQRLVWATRAHRQSLATVRTGIASHLDK